MEKDVFWDASYKFSLEIQYNRIAINKVPNCFRTPYQNIIVIAKLNKNLKTPPLVIFTGTREAFKSSNHTPEMP